MTILALLFHPVQDLFRLFFRLVVHARFRDFRLKAAHIGNIFRVHVVELLLQKLDLLLKCGLPVELAVRILLGRLRLLANLINSDQLIDGALNLFHPRLPRALLHQLILFFPRNT